MLDDWSLLDDKLDTMLDAPRLFVFLLWFLVGGDAFAPRVAPRGGVVLRGAEVEEAVASLKIRDAADEAVVRENFEALARKAGAAAALRIAKNNGQSMRWSKERVGDAFDAWTSRFDGDVAAAADLCGKNPGLLYCRPTGKDGIANAPLDQAVSIANVMDFFRFGKS